MTVMHKKDKKSKSHEIQIILITKQTEHIIPGYTHLLCLFCESRVLTSDIVVYSCVGVPACTPILFGQAFVLKGKVTKKVTMIPGIPRFVYRKFCCNEQPVRSFQTYSSLPYVPCEK